MNRYFLLIFFSTFSRREYFIFLRESFSFPPWQEYFISSKLKSTLTTWISSVRLTSLYIRFWRYHHHTSYLSFVPISKEKLNKYFTKMYIFIFHFILMFTLAHNFQKETTRFRRSNLYFADRPNRGKTTKTEREKSNRKIWSQNLLRAYLFDWGKIQAWVVCKFWGKIIQKSKHSHLSVYISTYTNEHCYQEKLLIKKWTYIKFPRKIVINSQI